MVPDQPDNNNSISGAEQAPEPREPSLREIAEAAYDEGSSPDAEQPSDGRVRDER